MREPLGRVQESVRHLRYVDHFFRDNNPVYEEMRTKMTAIPTFRNFLNDLYFGQDGRAMILGDVIEYIVTGRMLYQGYEKAEDFSKILFYLANQLMIQENVIRNPTMRKKLLEYMESQKGLRHFFTGDDQNWKKKYEETKDAPKEEVIGVRKRHYRVIDSILPKSLGTATELLVLAYLINSKLGFVIPLLTTQRIQSPQGRTIAPPDFLMIRGKRFYGLEVGVGQGGIGKIDQGNLFAAQTGVPVITVKVNPPNNVASYRCPKCGEWILYCDTLIEAYSKEKIDAVNEKLQEIDTKCPDFPDCRAAIFYGDLGEGNRHYHYNCVKGEEKVKRALGNHKVTHMSLYVEGFEGFA